MIDQLRERLRSAGVTEADLAADPVDEFGRWFALARQAGCAQPEAMAVATVDPDGAPRVRNVLCRRVDADGLVFFSNSRSPKGRALAAEPRVEALFSWLELDRQVRVSGSARPVDDATSDAYFATRPRLSQLAAHASRQSEPLGSRAELEARVAELDERYAGGDVPRPGHWFGYRIAPVAWEFWQGRDGRLHDRFRYDPTDAGGWAITRLDP